ncbi:MAG: hypothetical protein UY13_C0002G0405 [Candidatus Pacebacteria bacterium GW2011_GWB1_47_8]|nr:MAG: hypothetical protein UX28_C0001G0552 [Candidatus Pacebacteria bacterium GW2011_GWA1_46_10]KKU84493.1 MAG: hypothetical protein UY13_C0002G0405 [Candidatus Pacebacteria bacterium GW2011_GWB1_47_8]
MTTQNKILIAVLVLAAIGGSIATFVKLGVVVIPPLTFTFLRFFVAALCMLPFISKEIRQQGFHQLSGAIGISLLAVANVVIFAFGVRHTTAVISSLMYATGPLMIALLSYFWLKERFSLRKTLGILLGFLGVAYLVILPVFSKGADFSGTLFGNVTVLLAVICFVLYIVFSKRYQARFSAPVMAFVFAVTASVVLLPFVIIDWYAHPGWIGQVNSLTLLSVGYVGILGGAIFYLLYQKVIQKASPVIASMNLFIQPISAYISGLIFLKEKLITGVVIGAVAALIGAWLVTTDKNKKADNAGITRG